MKRYLELFLQKEQQKAFLIELYFILKLNVEKSGKMKLKSVFKELLKLYKLMINLILNWLIFQQIQTINIIYQFGF
ncbi:unnamed protein product [Paramecium sonneborni]|uniref:Uncharacterized protein n=1 Tax=Paramecium sonneborni TaxID=65129 RepID=A0A8S1KSY1_9CILI|nr:unnamed protein product [Paramecium sonneborni]